MDSLTQIVLGAAVGEVALGKKIGNRAMLWGAFAGTIPDLDVIFGQFMSKVDAIAFHRGITHSIFFAIFFSLAISYLVSWYYKNGYHKKKAARLLSTIAGIGFMLFVSFVLIFINHFLTGKIGLALTAIICLGGTFYFSRRLIHNYRNKEVEDIPLSWKEWYLLFFWSIFTHPILDSCTAYGTQLFAPFSNYRVAWNNISIVDPIFTLPFLAFLVAASMMTRNHPRRRIYNWVGIGISSMYMLFTVFNKLRVDQIMEDTLTEKNIHYSRYMTSPTIFNNILWSGTVESDSVFYFGEYSLFDKEKSFKLYPIRKNHEIIEDLEGNKSIETVKWFSNNYYNVMDLENDTLQINDLRYGVRGGGDPNDVNNYVFKFLLAKDEKGEYELINERRPTEEEATGMFQTLFIRIKGI